MEHGLNTNHTRCQPNTMPVRIRHDASPNQTRCQSESHTMPARMEHGLNTNHTRCQPESNTMPVRIRHDASPNQTRCQPESDTMPTRINAMPGPESDTMFDHQRGLHVLCPRRFFHHREVQYGARKDDHAAFQLLHPSLHRKREREGRFLIQSGETNLNT